jgi:hypothetical protein
VIIKEKSKKHYTLKIILKISIHSFLIWMGVVTKQKRMMWMKVKKKVEAEVWKASRNVYPKLSSLRMLRPEVERSKSDLNKDDFFSEQQACLVEMVQKLLAAKLPIVKLEYLEAMVYQTLPCASFRNQRTLWRKDSRQKLPSEACKVRCGTDPTCHRWNTYFAIKKN